MNKLEFIFIYISDHVLDWKFIFIEDVSFRKGGGGMKVSEPAVWILRPIHHSKQIEIYWQTPIRWKDKTKDEFVRLFW